MLILIFILFFQNYLGCDNVDTDLNKKHIKFRPPPVSLQNAIDLHEEWLSTGFERGERLIVNNKTFRYINFEGIDLRWADLRKSNFIWCNFKEANLDNAYFNEANLSHSIFQNAEIIGAQIINANLSYADFVGAKMMGVQLDRSKLRFSNFSGANLTDCSISFADFYKARLNDSIFKPCDSENAKMKGVLLSGADLRGGRFNSVEFEGARFDKAKIGGAYFEPSTIPEAQDFGDVEGLKEIIVGDRYATLILLAKKLKESGYKRQYSKLLCAIKRAEFGNQAKYVSIPMYILFDLTCEYGSNLERPLFMFVVLLIIFLGFYIIALLLPSLGTIVYCKFKSPKNQLSSQFTLVEVVSLNDNIRSKIRKIPKILFSCFVFSIISQTRYIELGSLSLNKWIMHFFFESFDIISTKVVKVIAALQSVLGIYFISLMVISFIWNPISL